VYLAIKHIYNSRYDFTWRNSMKNSPINSAHLGEIDIREYIHIVLKRKWLALTCFLIPVVLVTTISIFQKPIFRSVAKVEVGIGYKMPLKDVYEEVRHSRSQTELLSGGDLQKRALKRLDSWKGKIPKAYRKPEISVKGIRVTNMIGISADSPYGDYAKAYIQAMLDEYLVIKKEQRQTSSQSTLIALSGEIAKISDKLSSSQAKLQKFREENEDILLEEDAHFSSNYMLTLASRVSSLEVKKRLFKKQIDAIESNDNPSSWISIVSNIQRGYGGVTPSQEESQLYDLHEALNSDSGDLHARRLINKTSGMSDPGFFSLMSSNKRENRWEKLKNRYNELRMELSRVKDVYRPKHPQRIRLERDLKETVDGMRFEMSALLETFKEEYGSIEMEIAANKEHMEELRRAALSSSSKVAQLEALKKEDERLQKLYGVLLKRANEVEVSSGSGPGTFRIIDAPRVLSHPVGPKRLRNIVVSILFGAGLALGIAFLLDYIDNSIKSLAGMKELTGLSGLGLIHSVDWDNLDISRRNILYSLAA